MTPIWKVSDEEVWTAIRYLDPDNDHKAGKPAVVSSKQRQVRWIKAGALILALLLILYLAGLRYLPAALRLFR